MGSGDEQAESGNAQSPILKIGDRGWLAFSRGTAREEPVISIKQKSTVYSQTIILIKQHTWHITWMIYFNS